MPHYTDSERAVLFLIALAVAAGYVVGISWPQATTMPHWVAVCCVLLLVAGMTHFVLMARRGRP